MAKGRKKAEPVDETEDIDEDDLGDDSGDDFDADLDDDDNDDGDESDELVDVDLLMKGGAGAATAQSARRRVEDYLEMKRAARELSDIEDFDLD